MKISDLRGSLLRMQERFGDLDVVATEVKGTLKVESVLFSPIVAAKIRLDAEDGDSLVLVTEKTEDLVLDY